MDPVGTLRMEAIKQDGAPETQNLEPIVLGHLPPYFFLIEGRNRLLSCLSHTLIFLFHRLNLIPKFLSSLSLTIMHKAALADPPFTPEVIEESKLAGQQPDYTFLWPYLYF